MTELQAAVGLAQIKNIDQHVGAREDLCLFLNEHLKELPGISVPKIRPGCRHVFYVWALLMMRIPLGSAEIFFAGH